MYEIGQQVVCVKSHSQGRVKEGEIFTIKDLRLCKCCKYLEIDIGLKYNGNPMQVCTPCRHLDFKNGVQWTGHELFRPIDDLYNTEIEELMNEVNEKQPFEV